MGVIRRSRKVKAARPEASEPLQPIAIEPESEEEDGDESEGSSRAGRSDPDSIILRYKERIVNRKTAIRSHCIECMGGIPSEVARCPEQVGCSLWPYRMGENPNDKRTIAARQKRGEE